MSTPEDRVRAVIADSGLSQSQFAARIGLEPTKLSKSLSGARRFTSLDYANIAAACGVTVDWLLTGVEAPLATAARAASGSDAQVPVALARRYAELRATASKLGFERPGVSLGVALTGGWKRDGEALAVAALALCSASGVDPLVGPLPDAIEAAFGFDVVIAPLGLQFDGLAARFERGGMILACTTPNFARQRFTIAHELGHLLAGDDQGVHSDADIESTASRVGESEVRANAFAAAFLMPEPLLRSAVSGRLDEASFCELVAKLRVSPSALANRLENLRLVDPILAASFRQLTYREALQKRGGSWPTDEATRSLAQRPPARLASELLDAYLRRLATLRPYASALGVSTDEVRAQFENEG